MEQPYGEKDDEKNVWKNSHICFDKVSYQTKEGQWILKDINLKIPQGTKLAILAPSGSGKTTLLKLMK
ncbi:ATP-binding cassette domain-containing protein, partial [Micrococcus sp. SIMBA_131]